MSGPSLFETNRLPLAFWADHDGLKIQEIAVIALLVQRFDTQMAFAAINGHIACEIRIFQTTHAPLADLGPELAVFVPAQPIASPPCFRIRRERHRASKAVLPVSENRIALVRHERSFGA